MAFRGDWKDRAEQIHGETLEGFAVDGRWLGGRRSRHAARFVGLPSGKLHSFGEGAGWTERHRFEMCRWDAEAELGVDHSQEGDVAVVEAAVPKHRFVASSVGDSVCCRAHFPACLVRGRGCNSWFQMGMRDSPWQMDGEHVGCRRKMHI